ncbi:hypothetical protein BH23ACT10_BH23ACT10_33570 [soil metagenome]
MTDTKDAGIAHARSRTVACRYTVVAGALIGTIATVALTGWTLHLRLLASVIPGAVTMRANTAVAFLAIAVSLIIAGLPHTRLRGIGASAALMVLAVGGLTTAEYALGVDLRIDQLVFAEFPNAVRTSHPGRMALNAALCFAFIGWALYWLHNPRRRYPVTASASVAIVAIVALQACVGYATGVSELHGFGPWTDMAVPTAVAFALAATGALAARPGSGVMAVLTADGVAGTTLRRLLPIVIAGPLVLAGIATAGQRQGLVTADLAVWLLTTFLIVLLATAALRLVGTLDLIERDRSAITTRHDESERRFKAMTESAQDAIVIADTAGTITYANRAAQAMFGHDDPGLQGRNLITLMPAQLREAHTAGLERFIETGVPRLIGRVGDVTARRADGTEFPAQISLSTWDVHGTRNFAGVIRDVTAQKQSEAELERARDEALAASRLKSAFVMNMSHELRTPLNGVMGMSELLTTTQLTDKQTRYNDTLMHSADSMLQLVNELLDFADLEAGELEVEHSPTAVGEVVREVVDHAVARVAERPLVVNAMVDDRVPETVVTDPLRLRQIVMHLVGNALKFTPDGRVQLTVDVATDDGGGADVVRISVTDTGIGMAPELLAAIFTPFSQADVSSTRRFGGAGLGLTISHRLAELLGGRVTGSSEPGLGSTFTVTIPLIRPDASAWSAAPPPLPSASPTADAGHDPAPVG